MVTSRSQPVSVVNLLILLVFIPQAYAKAHMPKILGINRYAGQNQLTKDVYVNEAAQKGSVLYLPDPWSYMVPATQKDIDQSPEPLRKGMLEHTKKRMWLPVLHEILDTAPNELKETYINQTKIWPFKSQAEKMAQEWGDLAEEWKEAKDNFIYIGGAPGVSRVAWAFFERSMAGLCEKTRLLAQDVAAFAKVCDPGGKETLKGYIKVWNEVAAAFEEAEQMVNDIHDHPDWTETVALNGWHEFAQLLTESCYAVLEAGMVTKKKFEHFLPIVKPWQDLAEAWEDSAELVSTKARQDWVQREKKWRLAGCPEASSMFPPPKLSNKLLLGREVQKGAGPPVIEDVLGIGRLVGVIAVKSETQTQSQNIGIRGSSGVAGRSIPIALTETVRRQPGTAKKKKSQKVQGDVWDVSQASNSMGDLQNFALAGADLGDDKSFKPITRAEIQAAARSKKEEKEGPKVVKQKEKLKEVGGAQKLTPQLAAILKAQGKNVRDEDVIDPSKDVADDSQMPPGIDDEASSDETKQKQKGKKSNSYVKAQSSVAAEDSSSDEEALEDSGLSAGAGFAALGSDGKTGEGFAALAGSSKAKKAAPAPSSAAAKNLKKPNAAAVSAGKDSDKAADSDSSDELSSLSSLNSDSDGDKKAKKKSSKVKKAKAPANEEDKAKVPADKQDDKPKNFRVPKYAKYLKNPADAYPRAAAAKKSDAKEDEKSQSTSSDSDDDKAATTRPAKTTGSNDRKTKSSSDDSSDSGELAEGFAALSTADSKEKKTEAKSSSKSEKKVPVTADADSSDSDDSGAGFFGSQPTKKEEKPKVPDSDSSSEPWLSAEYLPGISTIPALGLMYLCTVSGIAFAVISYRRGTLLLGEVPLLAV